MKNYLTYIQLMVNHAMGIEEISYDELSSIELSVSVPNYQGNKYYKTSKRTKLRLKKFEEGIEYARTTKRKRFD